jgi:rare lipoprotein A
VFTAVPPVPPAVPLGPVGIGIASASTLALPAHTSLRLRSEELNVLEGHSDTITGTLSGAGRAALGRRVVLLQTYLGRRAGAARAGWHTIARGRTTTGGFFRLSFVARRLGSRLVRVSFPGDAFDLPAAHRLGQLNVYRLAGASWYGGGGSLACGGQLTSSTLGVANKTLPCGTLVTLHYGGRTVRVPVVDRGPYVEGREFDLTEATKAALGFGDTGNVWSTR